MDKLEQRLDSREVAEMIGKEHNKLMRDIRTYIEQLGESKIGHTDFFIESKCLTAQNKEIPCYLVTKKGCEFIAHKLTGTKGTEFTARYINRFHEISGELQKYIPQGNELIAMAVLEAQKLLHIQGQQIEEMKPKAVFADAVSASGDVILIGELAKMLRQNGIDIGQNRLFEWMRENRYLISNGIDRNMPTQRAMDMKLFKIKERTVQKPDGSVRITKTTLVTGKGQQYFINKFLG